MSELNNNEYKNRHVLTKKTLLNVIYNTMRTNDQNLSGGEMKVW